MNITKTFPYTKDMIESENLFLKNLDKYKEMPLKQFPTDNISIGHFQELSYGVNKGEKVPIELKNRLEKKIDANVLTHNLNQIDYQADVVIVGTGGAGLSAAIQAAENGAKVLILTKDKYGLSNTILAQGGIQAATEEGDSPEQHLEDTMKGGHYKSKQELVKKLAYEAPKALLWLESLGVNFDEEPIIPGGSKQKRLHTIGDNTGARIMKALGNRVKELEDKISIIQFADAKEILEDEQGGAAGIIFKKENDYKIVQSKVVILATGGSGSLCYNNLGTSNCKGSTADGLAMAYHMGAKLINPGDIQYHPTGGAYPINTYGKLVSEKARSLGALLFNSKGEALQSTGNRDDIVRLILSEEANGNIVKTPDGNNGVWLATPLIDKINGEGTIEKRLPTLFKKYQAENIDIRKHAILIYPTVHYHLGGIEIDTKGMSTVHNLFAVGEVSGGIDGANRLMGNALASIIVYGCTAGKEAAQIAKKKEFSKELSLNYLLENDLIETKEIYK